MQIKADETTTLLTSPDPKVLITQSQIYIFYLHSRHDVENEFQIDGAAKDNKEDLLQERVEVIESQNIVEVRDYQVYDIMDFEFIQRLQQPKRSFILRKYNKLLTNQEMPYLQIECTKDEQYFILTHLIERQLPMKWQAFFEKALLIQQPDCY